MFESPPPPPEMVIKMKTVTIKCAECGKLSEKPKGEIKRQRKNGRNIFFCSLSCSSTYHCRPKKLPKIMVMCEYCGKEFETTSGRKRSRFCSRSCASAGSVTDYRRAKARETGLSNAVFLAPHIGDGLRTREWWKYIDINGLLDKHGVRHIFEWQSGNCVFDLKLDDYNVLIEFDGPYHRSDKQKALDAEKDKVAKDLGYRIIRAEIERASAVPVEVMEKILLGEQII